MVRARVVKNYKKHKVGETLLLPEHRAYFLQDQGFLVVVSEEQENKPILRQIPYVVK